MHAVCDRLRADSVAEFDKRRTPLLGPVVRQHAFVLGSEAVMGQGDHRWNQIG